MNPWRGSTPSMSTGARFVVVANHRSTSAPEDVAEMEEILASIEFEP